MPWFFLLAQSTEWMYNFTRSAIHFYLRSLASQPASHRCCVAKPRSASLCGASCAREQKAKETSKWLFTQIFETFCKGKNWFFFRLWQWKKGSISQWEFLRTHSNQTVKTMVVLVFFRIVLFDCFASGECLLFSSHGRLRIFRNEKIIEVPPSPISLFE